MNLANRTYTHWSISSLAACLACWLAGCSTDVTNTSPLPGTGGGGVSSQDASSSSEGITPNVGGGGHAATGTAGAGSGVTPGAVVGTAGGAALADGGGANGDTIANAGGERASGVTAQAPNPDGGGTIAKMDSGANAGGSIANTGGSIANTGGQRAGGSSANAGGASSHAGGGINDGGTPANVDAGVPRVNAGGSTGQASGLVAPCAAFSKAPTVTGTLFAGATGISGVLASRKQPGVLWIHSDRQKVLYAVDETGALLGSWTLTTTTSRFFFVYNWEDIGIQPVEGGPDRIWVGDIGNNFVRGGGDPRTSVRLMSIDEPTVDTATDAEGTAPIIGIFDMTYPDGLHDAEAMSVDPLTGDVYVFTKEEESPSKIFRAKAPVQSGEFEYLGTIDSSNLNGADFSASGRELLVRNYTQAYYWALPTGKAWSETVVTPPDKTFRLQWTTGYYPEAIGFSSDETGFYVVSEEEDGGPPSPVEFYNKTCK